MIFRNFLDTISRFLKILVQKICDFSRIFHFPPTLRGSFSMTTEPISIFSKNKYKYFPRSVDCARFQLSIYLFSLRSDSMKIGKIEILTFTTLTLGVQTNVSLWLSSHHQFLRGHRATGIPFWFSACQVAFFVKFVLDIFWR